MKFRSYLQAFANLAVKMMLARSMNYRRANLAGFPIQHAEYDGRDHRPRPGIVIFTFVGLDLSVQRVSDSMEHEPRGTLSNLQIARHFVGAHAGFAVGNEPHSHEPLVQPDSGIFEDRTDLNRKLLTAFKTCPKQPGFEERQPLVPAFWAFRAFRPLGFGNSCQTHHWVRKVADSIKQATRTVELFWFHAPCILLRYV